MLHKVGDIIRAHGLTGLARRSIAYSYRRGFRPYLPGKPVHYAGIPICDDRKWGDQFVPRSWIPEAAAGADEPDYEAALVAGLKEIVRPEDTVVIVGAGLGVTAVVAALRAPSGAIQCFEGNKQCVRAAQQTAARNKVTNISFHHAIVAKAIFVYGSPHDVGTVIPASQIPKCNVLQLDCEGAEVEILRELTIQPRAILVETHGIYGAPANLVASLLMERGYVVSDRGLAEPRLGELHAQQDVRVLLGRSH